ncbi:MAG: hypothetical protein GY780_03820 [bacterium]|nr:hypothetical protein [bacterium]
MKLILMSLFFVCFSVIAFPAEAEVIAYWVGVNTRSVNESIPNVIISIALSEPATGSTGVHYQIKPGGTATEGLDYIGVSGVLYWETGENYAQNITISLIDDDIVESMEFFEVEIDAADGAEISPLDSIMQIQIQDNDTGYQVTLAKSSTNPGVIIDRFCRDESGEYFECGTRLLSTYEGDETLSFSVIVTPAPVSPDVVTVTLEPWGAMSLEVSQISVGSSGFSDVPFDMNDSAPASLGGVDIVSVSGIDFWNKDLLADLGVYFYSDVVILQGCIVCVASAVIGIDCHSLCSAWVVCERNDGEKISGTDLELLRRYRDEILASSNEGLAVTDLYQSMSPGLALALVSDPTLISDFSDLRNKMWPLLENILDGDGNMVLTAEMQSSLTNILDRLEAEAPSETTATIASLRTEANLDGLTGQTATAVQNSFVQGVNVPTQKHTWGKLKSLFR